MPYQWMPDTATSETQLHLWPHRSLTAQGFVWFIGGTAALMALPLMSLLGSPVMLAILPFLLIVLALIWIALRRNLRDAQVIEVLTLRRDALHLTHHAKGRAQVWEANPYWVRPVLHRKGGPVEDYLTLQGGPREVELGAFLTPEERQALHDELQAALAKLR